MKRNRGISLIVLVITIIVIIILAGAVILNLVNNNLISQAEKATFINDLRNFQTELNLYETKQFSDKQAIYDVTNLQADETSVTYNDIVDNTKTIDDLIPTLGKATKYAGQFIVVDGELVFQGLDTQKQDWARESEIEVVIPSASVSTDTGEYIDDIETFENGINNTVYDYTGDWGIISNDAYEGTYCYSNKDINDSETSSSTFNVNVPNDGYEYKLKFYYKTSSETNYDFLNLYINGNFIMQDSGVKPSYVFYEEILPQGNNSVQFTYTKDSSGDSGNDSVYIDNIQLIRDKIAAPIMSANPSPWTTTRKCYSYN